MEDYRELFEYLNELRKSGSVNMFGVVKLLQEEFDLDKKTAIEVIKIMETVK